jgi:hypothetical protein
VIRWRNDFDWTGVRITAAALGRYPNAVSWRMSGAVYRAAVGVGRPLLGVPADTPWDADLRAAMEEAGHAVMEERLLDLLLDDLRPTCRPNETGRRGYE